MLADPRMLSVHYASWRHAEEYLDEPAAVEQAREIADRLGLSPVSPGAGAALRLLAAAVGATNVVEIGTGTGVSGAWLLGGIAAEGVLTSIDLEAEHQRAAKATFSALDIPANQIRLITGRALDVLPRLADSAYDLAFVDAEPTDYADYVEQAARLLRVGGVLVLANALGGDKVADPAQRDPATVALRGVVNALRDDERWTPALLPTGAGLLVGVRTAG